MNEPEQKPKPEIRGGDRPEDYIPEGSGGFGRLGWDGEVIELDDENEDGEDDHPR